MQPYSAREALGQYWMKDLDNGAYRNEAYVAHISKDHTTVVFIESHDIVP
jgi:hypothetical protein